MKKAAATPPKTRSSPRGKTAAAATTKTNGHPSTTRPPWLVQAVLVAAVWGVVLFCVGLQWGINSAWSMRVMQSSCSALRDTQPTPRLSSILASAAFNASTTRTAHQRRANPAMGIYPKCVALHAVGRVVTVLHAPTMRTIMPWGDAALTRAAHTTGAQGLQVARRQLQGQKDRLLGRGGV